MNEHDLSSSSPVRVASIYNPQNQTKAQLVEGFVVRQNTFKTLFKAIKEAKMEVPEQHYLLLGRRGMGKTTLLLRLAYEVENDPTLNNWLIPLVFNEEEYGIRRLFNFWERIMDLLEQQHPEFRFEAAERKRLSLQYKDDDTYERALFDWFSTELNRLSKKVILFIDNFGDMAQKLNDDEAHRLRKILQTSADIRIIAASAVVLEAFYKYDHPFYEFFKVVELKGLDAKETRELLLSLSQYYKKEAVTRILEQNPGRVEALRRVTGGVIRTIVLLFEIFADDDDGSAFKDLEFILDRATPLYKHRMDDLSPQQQAIVEAIALNWDALSVKEITETTRLESKVISAQLQYLERNGIIQKIPTKTKNHFYIVSERFFNIWFLMRLGRRSDEKRVLWLVRFFEDWCDDEMMKSRAELHRVALQRGGFDVDAAYTYTQVFLQTQKLNAADRHELIRDTRSFLLDKSPDLVKDLAPSDLEQAYEALEMWFSGHQDVAIEKLMPLCEKIISKKRCDAIAEGIKSEGLREFWEKEMTNLAYDMGLSFINLKQPDLEKAECCWLWLAEAGNGKAMYALGWLFNNKAGNIEKAEEWYLKAAEAGNPNAMNNLGWLFESKKKDIEKAEEWYLKAAEAGNPNAMNNLGWLFESEKKDIEKAEEWYLKAADAGNTNAMDNLAWLFKNEKKELDKAFEWYLKAANLGNTDAMNNLGQLFEEEKKDIEKSIKWYKKAAEAGNAIAMSNLGWLFEHEKKDIDKAFEWYQKAADAGNTNAMNNLGLLFKNEKKHMDKAFEWYQKAANAENINAMNNLGVLFKNEKKDFDKAFEWYQRAADAGNSTAMVNLGELYRNEKNDLDKAEEWYEKAAEGGNFEGMNSLAWLYFNQHTYSEQALDWAIKGLAIAAEDNWLRHTAACVFAWNNRMIESKDLALLFIENQELLEKEHDDIITYFVLMLAKSEASWLLSIFTSPDNESLQLKDRFKPIYYAILKTLDHPDALRMGEELRQTVDEILAKAKQMAIDYA